VVQAAINARGQIAWLTHDGRLRFSDETAYRSVLKMGQDDYVQDLYLSEDGNRVGLRTSSEDIVWDRSLGRVVGALQSGPLSPDGRLTFSTGASGIRLHDVETGTVIARAPAWHHRLAFSPDGSRAATPEDEVVIVWNVTTGKVERRLNVKADHVMFSRDGRLLLTDAMLWDLETGVHRTIPSQAPCWLSPNAALLACTDGVTIEIIRARDLAKVLRLDLVTDAPAAVAFANGELDLLGDEASGRRSLACRIGTQLLDFEVCEERFRARGLARRAAQ
jgi:WD40 repeat protein